MKDLTKIVEGDYSPSTQNNPNKVTSRPIVNKPHVAVTKNNTSAMEASATKNLTNGPSKGTANNNIVTVDKNAISNNKKVTNVNAKIAKAKFPAKGKFDGKNIVQHAAVIDNKPKSKKENEEIDLGKTQKKKVIVIKKNTKNAEEKVDYLKKKHDKAKKKDVKTGKLKVLKEKVKKAFKKLKNSLRKLKKAEK